jgi:hypothetical protein
MEGLYISYSVKQVHDQKYVAKPNPPGFQPAEIELANKIIMSMVFQRTKNY